MTILIINGIKSKGIFPLHYHRQMLSLKLNMKIMIPLAKHFNIIK